MHRLPALLLPLSIVGLFTFSGLGLALVSGPHYNSGQGGRMMSQLTGAGQVQADQVEAGQVETRPDGSKVFTHGHRYPDNTQIVTQTYDAAGTLASARVEWTGFAGKVLDVTATFDKSGKLLGETGFRASDMTTPVSELLRPLPAASTTAESRSAAADTAPAADAPADTAPVVVPSLAPAPLLSARPAAVTPATASAPAAAEGIQDGLNQIYGDVPQRQAAENGRKKSND